MKKLLLIIFAIAFYSTTFGQPLTGIKTIPGDYATITAAVSALNTQGVGAGGVTFNVAAGYTETISAPLSITATGTVSNPIMFQKNGAGANPLITAYVGTNTPGSAVQDGIWNLVGSDYITIDGINLTDPNTTNPATMEYGFGMFKASVTDGCQNNTIKNCAVTLSIANNATGTAPAVDGSRAINLMNSLVTTQTTVLVPTTAGGTNSNNKFYSNTLQNCNIGIALIGYAGATPFTLCDFGNDVGGNALSTGNSILNYGGATGATNPAAGVRTLAQYNLNVSYNTLNNNNGTGVNHVNVLRGIYNNTATSANATISYNTLTLSSGATTSLMNGIENVAGSTAAANSININNNTLQNFTWATATTGVFSAITNSGTPLTLNIYNNIISNISIPSTGNTYGINGGGPTNLNIYGNEVGNITKTVSGTLYAMAAATAIISVHDNNVHHLNMNAGGNAIYGFYDLSSPVNETYYNNTFNNFTNIGTGGVFGIYTNTSAGTRNVYSNTIYNFNASGGGPIWGIYGAASSPNIYKNRLYNLSSGTAGGTIWAIHNVSGTTANIYNNFVSDLKTPAATAAEAIRGISITGGTTANIFDNTIYINATSSSVTTFGTSGIYKLSTTIGDLRNNIVVNVSTPGPTGGFTVAYRWSGAYSPTYYAATSNNNDFYAGTPAANMLIFYDGTNSDQTMTSYKARVAPRDAASITENPPFVNVATAPYDLHIQTTVPTQLESGGIVIATPISITDDYDANPRYPNSGYPNNILTPANAPDMGADEFGGLFLDIVPPTMTYTPLNNTVSLLARTLTATITDISGVPVSGIGLPVLYWKKTGDPGYTAVQGVSLGGNQYSFTFGAGVSTGNTVSYYIAAQDMVTPTPNVGTSPSAGASGFTANPPNCSIPPTTPNTYVIMGYLCGSYNVGVGQVYTTLTAAVTDFNNNQISCPVTFILTDATYPSETYPIVINPNPGASAVNTLTIKVGTGVTTMLTASLSSLPLLKILNNYTIIDGSNTVGGTTRNLTISNTSATAPNVLLLGSTGTTPLLNCTIKNSVLINGTSTSTAVVVSDGTTLGNPGYFNNIVIQNNSIQLAYMGLYCTATVLPGNGSGLLITGNDINASGANSIRLCPIYVQGVDGVTVSNNNLGNISNANNEMVRGIWLATGTNSGTVSGNTITNLTLTNTGTSAAIAGIYVTPGATATGITITNNTVSNLTNSGTLVSFAGIIYTSPNTTVTGNTISGMTQNGAAAFWGLIGAGVTNSVISANTVSGLNTSTTGVATGINVQGASSSVTISKNKVYNIKNTNSGGYSADGILLSSSTVPANIIISNNLIYDVAGYGYGSLTTDNGYGIWISSGGGYSLYYNSVRLSTNQTLSTGDPACLLISSGITLLDIRNNIFYIDVTSGTDRYAVLCNSANTAFTNINNNDYYSSDPNTWYLGSNISTLSGWRTATAQDVNSISADPMYLGLTDLRPNMGSPVLGAATFIAGVADDFLGVIRNVTTPAIGAYEIGVDASGPIIIYTPLGNTLLTTARTITATITDYSGVPVSGAGLPVLYWKINAGVYTPAIATSLGGNQYQFTLGAGVVTGDVVSYYIAAQDNDLPTPLVSCNPSPGASGFTINPPAAGTPPTTPNTYQILPGIGGSFTVGTSGTYPSLTGAGGLFAAINGGVLTSNITATILSDLTEDGTNALNQWGEDPASSNYTLTIQPDASLRTISGTAVGSGIAMIRINGADRMTIDGGASKHLLFRNTNSTAANTGGTFLFSNGCVNDQLKNCVIENNGTSATGGNILISGSATNLVISNNDIRDATGGTTGLPVNIIYASASAGPFTLSNNNIYNFTGYGCYLSSVSDACSITGNSFYYNAGTAASGSQYPIYVLGGNNHSITGNFIGGQAALCGGSAWTNTGAGTFFGINLSVGSVTATSVQNNTIQNLAFSGTATFYGIYCSGGMVNIGTATGNIIGSPSLANAITFAGSSSCYGIYSSSSVLTSNFENNSVSNITYTVASGSPTFEGFYIYGGNVRKNKVYSIGASNAALTPVIYGIYDYGVSNSANEYSNNSLALDGGAATNPVLYGIYVNTYTTDVSTFGFNSVSITGPATTTSSTYCFYRTSSSPDVLKANIFSNNRMAGGTGKHYANYTSNVTAWTSDYNDLYSLAGPLGYWGGDLATLASWRTASAGDANAQSVDPLFISSTDLHTIKPELNNAGIAVTGITTDITGAVRTNPPDIGAYEFSKAVTSINTLAATLVGQTTATINGNINTANEVAAMSFEYGLTTGYGTNPAATPTPVRSLILTPVSAGLVSLAPNTLYHYRVKGVSATSSETAYGLDMTFVTLPSPTLTGPNNICAGTSGNVYTTEPGNSNYIWSVSSGGTVTLGGGTSDNTVTVTWTTAGAKTVSVNYNNSVGQPAPSPTVYNVTVNALPVPVITGAASVCAGSTLNVYSTASGMTNYIWTVSTGGTVTAGGTGTDNTVTVTWNTAGARSVSINYTNGNGCTAASPTAYNVTVNPIPNLTTFPLAASICNNGTTNIILTSSVPGTFFTWTTTGSSGNVFGFSPGTGVLIMQTLINTGFNTETVTYHITPHANGCDGIVYDYVVTLYPTPDLSNSPLNKSFCSGNSTNLTLTSNVAGTLFTWTASGSSGNVTGYSNNAVPTVTLNQTLINTGNVTETVTYHILPSANGCSGPIYDYIVTVYPIPAPTISGPVSVCLNSTGNVYTTESGKSNYSWSISAGGIITSGGGTGDNTATVTWNTLGAQTLGVNYNGVGGCTAPGPLIYNVTVNPLPVPTITGPTPVCLNSTGNVYSTESGKSNYTWLVSSGGIVTSGGGAGDHTVTITWTTTGAHSVTINYTDGNSCTAAIPFVYNVIVNPLPAPTISGPNSVCINSIGNVYLTQVGKTNYSWGISSGGTMTSGGGVNDNTLTVTWNTAGPQFVTINYSDANNCTAQNPFVYAITVNPLPIPAITGGNNPCAGTSVTYSTEAGMTGYTWIVSAGGNITTGGGTSDNTVTVHWNVVGPQSVSVSYTDLNGCTSASATAYPINVNSVTTPTITGLISVCTGTTGVIYTTETGMLGYTWNISAGGTITGGTGTNSITVNWNITGAQTVGISYTDPGGCSSVPTIKNVTVNPLPVPAIAGSNSVCLNSSANVYTTQAGMTNYLWNVSAGGTVTAGGTTTSNSVTVTWNTTGPQTVSVNYTNTNGCTALSPTDYSVTVNPLPAPTIAGPIAVCAGTTGVIYSTQAGMSAYSWSISGGGTITAGSGTNSVTVTWSTNGAQTISVNYTNTFGCTIPTPTVYNVTVNALPVPTITGSVSVCVNSTGNIYTTQVGMSAYTWSVSAGGAITAGTGTNAITVTWNTAGSQTVSVNYTNGSGCTAASPVIYNVTVNSLPVPTLAGPASVCAGTAANIYTTQAGMTNYVWSVSAGGTVTAGGTSGSNTVTITWNTAGPQTVSVNYTNSNGCTAASPVVYNVTVNALPVPTITGPASVCLNSTGNVYTTQAGMTGYTWVVSAGGAITLGSGTNAITVTWSTVGAKTVTVNYTNANSCTAVSPTVYNVTVNALPAPTLAGSASVCVNSVGNVYTTQAGMTNYIWAVSGGGTVTSGGTTGSNTVTITWNTAGAQTVSVNYTNANGCTAASPTVYNVTVNALPVPTISGPAAVCVNSAGNIYTTQAGMSGYNWNISGGGSITAGAGTNTVTVTWSTIGAQTLSVNYTNANGCTAASPSVYNVTVNARPAPTITGPVTVCAGTTGNIYTTESGMSAYTWIVSGGGTLTGGAGTNTITVTWNTSGAQTVSVNYNNAAGCPALVPTVYNVTVNALPVPTITGPATACAGSTGNVYTTQAGMSAYSWVVSGGGSISGGGGTSAITVTWNTAGAQTVSVVYTNAAGCTAAPPTVYNVTVSNIPAPAITGTNNLCINSGFYNYSTDPGMNNYIWNISSGGTINSGGTTNTVQVTWTLSGAQWISVTYTTPGGCSPASPTVLNVTVNPLPGPAGAITGTSNVCGGTTGVAYTVAVIPNTITYVWSLPAGATIVSGSGTNSITVNFAVNASSGNITVYGNNLCGNGVMSPAFPVTVTALPDPAGTISGPASVCQGESGVIYSVTPVPNATSYVWTVPAGATIVGATNTNTITIDFSSSASSGNVTTYGTNSCGNGNTGILAITLHPVPPAPVIVAIGDSLASNVPTGNQWYLNGILIAGATGQGYMATQPGIYWDVVIQSNCTSDTSNHIHIYGVGVNPLNRATISVYPVPNDGRFMIKITGVLDGNYSADIINNLGMKIFSTTLVNMNGNISREIDLRPIPDGVYSVIIRNDNYEVVKRIVVNK